MPIIWLAIYHFYMLLALNWGTRNILNADYVDAAN